ncbi:MAG: ferritin [Deltaproteobacteria bacterium]|nr:ferritin [Deltaproteobacteria bacterium]MBW1736952.1 ferritin [Deltaproteobacteria bacterium]MBW1910000.1 ferritin [Deltaproteobacteria bacterium]MBW2033289.1 ferritin [Deltaproteobacteria bacterium]MBW2114361.1 ferritin [Deltaproteobacteria bacterium]
MLNEKMERALNGQINAEMYSAYLYLSMSAYFESISLRGFASWMKVQAQEEMVHAMKFYAFINERGGRVILKSIEAPATEWASPLAAFEGVSQHEQKVTALINDLVELASKEHDYASGIFLQWFVTEQVEEEDSANEVVQKIKLMGDAKGGLFMLDRELGQRVFTPPAEKSEG